MDKNYLMIFLIMMGVFIYWYQKNVNNMFKKTKKNKKKKRKKKCKKKKQESSDSMDLKSIGIQSMNSTDSSTDSKIRKRNTKIIKPYNDKKSETDDVITLDSVSIGTHSGFTYNTDDISLDSVSSSDMEQFERTKRK
jgi:hypothetical protein